MWDNDWIACKLNFFFIVSDGQVKDRVEYYVSTPVTVSYLFLFFYNYFERLLFRPIFMAEVVTNNRLFCVAALPAIHFFNKQKKSGIDLSF